MYTPRKYDSEIIIDENDKWFYRGQEISQENVLEFFQKNLKEDDSGIYIENHYKQFMEMGYVKCQGYPLKIINYHKIDDTYMLEGSNGLIKPIKEFDFFTDKSGAIFVIKKKEKFIKYKINIKTLSFLSNHMVEKDEKTYLEFPDHSQEITPYKDSLTVDIPKEFN